MTVTTEFSMEVWSTHLRFEISSMLLEVESTSRFLGGSDFVTIS